MVLQFNKAAGSIHVSSFHGHFHVARELIVLQLDSICLRVKNLSSLGEKIHCFKNVSLKSTALHIYNFFLILIFFLDKERGKITRKYIDRGILNISSSFWFLFSYEYLHIN